MSARAMRTSMIPSKPRFNAFICVSTCSRDSPICPTRPARRSSNSVGWWDASLVVVGWEDVDGVAIIGNVTWCTGRCSAVAERKG